MPRILITGSRGQIGTELSDHLRKLYGQDQVICTDLLAKSNTSEPYEQLDVLDIDKFRHLIEKYDIEWLVHNASILSATGEKNPSLAMKVNIRGFENALELSKINDLRILSPSSIAAFGPETPKYDTPEITIMRPKTIYGITKVYMELLGDYYHQKWGVDFRSLRYPGIISHKTIPLHGTTDYAVAIFHEALKNKSYTCFLKAKTTLPMMYMPDCLAGTIQLLNANNQSLSHRTYNLAGFSFSPEELGLSIKKLLPEFKIFYKPDYRQKIAETWPKSIDDSKAKEDWNWAPSYTIDTMVEEMITNISLLY